MTVHNLKEYVAYHQQKLREQNARQSSTSTSTSSSQVPKRKGGVNQIHSKQEFAENVTSSEEVVLVDFFATWCGPCKMIAPHIAKMSELEQYSKVKFYKIDVDEAPEVAQEFGIRAMPTFVILKNGEKVDEIVGADPNAIKKKLDAVLQSKLTGEPYRAPPSETNWMSYLPMVILAVLIYRWYMGI